MEEDKVLYMGIHEQGFVLLEEREGGGGGALPLT
jgi:hypothetical protein